jgi:hypothetical protein
VLVHQESLDLVEHGGVRDVVITAVDGPAADNRERRLLRAHLAHLNRARVRPQ